MKRSQHDTQRLPLKEEYMTCLQAVLEEGCGEGKQASPQRLLGNTGYMTMKTRNPLYEHLKYDKIKPTGRD